MQPRQKGIIKHLQTTILLRAQGQDPRYHLCPTGNKNHSPQKVFSHQFLCPKGSTCATTTKKGKVQIKLPNSHEKKLSNKSVLVWKPPRVECNCHGLQTCHTQSARPLPSVSNGPEACNRPLGDGYVENAAVDSSREAGSIAQLVKKGKERRV